MLPVAVFPAENEEQLAQLASPADVHAAFEGLGVGKTVKQFAPLKSGPVFVQPDALPPHFTAMAVRLVATGPQILKRNPK
jgi:hypothetical protein